jgi:hypothetical protein
VRTRLGWDARLVENRPRADAFDALPPAARAAVYERMWHILSGKDASPRYTRLTPSDREAIVGILRDTKRGLPEYFRQERS